MAEPDLKKFLGSLEESLEEATFVKATIGNYKGGESGLQKVLLRRIATKKGDLVQFNFRYSDRDKAKNYHQGEAASKVAKLLDSGFRSAALFTTEKDISLTLSKKGRALLSISGPTFPDAPDATHDRAKKLSVSASEPFLSILGITTKDGKVRDKQQGKFRQINRFVEIIDGLIRDAAFDDPMLRIVDMGSGKGYLTFALYSHLASRSGLRTEMKGIEQRRELVDLCNAAAAECGFEGLSFVQSAIGESEIGDPDVVIALHACDTATDDAIFEGISRGAKVIVTAPCCQKELRPQIRFPEEAARLNSFGLLLENENETVTDGLRAILLEDCGYEVKMIDFVSPAHTPKNTLIAAVRKPERPALFEGSPAAESLMRLYGITSQRLHTLLRSSKTS